MSRTTLTDKTLLRMAATDTPQDLADALLLAAEARARRLHGKATCSAARMTIRETGDILFRLHGWIPACTDVSEKGDKALSTHCVMQRRLSGDFQEGGKS